MKSKPVRVIHARLIDPTSYSTQEMNFDVNLNQSEAWNLGQSNLFFPGGLPIH